MGALVFREEIVLRRANVRILGEPIEGRPPGERAARGFERAPARTGQGEGDAVDRRPSYNFV